MARLSCSAAWTLATEAAGRTSAASSTTSPRRARAPGARPGKESGLSATAIVSGTAEPDQADGATTTVLYVAHNHPHVRPGGAEAYALELYRAIRDTPRHAAFFLAKGGPPLSPVGQVHPGTLLAPAGGDDGQYFMFTDGYG